jgi:hypothetical protein
VGGSHVFVSRSALWRAVLVLCALVAAGVPGAATASAAGTQVGGVLAEDATWTAAAGPYYVSSTVQIPAGVTLTLEPGTEVVAQGVTDMFKMHGRVIAEGSVERPVDLDGGGRANFFTSSGAAAAVLHLSHVTVHDGLALWASTGRAQIAIEDSVLRNLSRYSYIYYPTSDSWFDRNLIDNAAGFSVGTDRDAQVFFRDNRFRGQSRSGSWVSQWAAYGGPTVVTGNAFEVAGSPTLELADGYGNSKMTATGNFWSTDDPAVIDSMIADSADSITRAGRIDHQPILDAPSASTPRTAPLQPTQVTAARTPEGTSVSWSSPVVDGGSPITGYTVTADPGGLSVTTNGGTTATLTGLDRSLVQRISVTASNAVGAGPASAPVDSAINPAVPSNVTVSPGDASATVSWVAPYDDGGSTITGYTVRASMGSWWHVDSPVGPDRTSTTVSGLRNGESYSFTVTATNAAGTSERSAAGPVVTPLGVPGPPTLDYVAVANSYALVTWDASGDDGGTPVTGFVIRTYRGSSLVKAQSASAWARHAAVTGLTNGTKYTFNVSARNAVGTGEASARSFEVLPVGPPGAPRIGAPTPGRRSAVVS